jgi:hypothetical protein
MKLSLLALSLLFVTPPLPPTLTPSLPVPGASPATVREVVSVAMNELRKGVDGLKSKVDVMKNPTQKELQCLAFTFSRMVSQAGLMLEDMMVGRGRPANLVRVAELQASATHFGKLEDDWCNGQGGKTERVKKFLEAYREKNAPMARALESPSKSVWETLQTSAFWQSYSRIGLNALPTSP